MKWMKTLIIALALLAGSSSLAAAQEGYGGWRQQDRDWDRDHDRFRFGDGDHDRDDGYRGQYPVYGGNPYYRTGIQQAQQNGYQYGLHDGQIDWQAGRSYRATRNETYEHANIGYVRAYGPKSRYRQVFRQAYLDGYQRGYGAGYGPYGRGPWGR